jgi:hypothetical protein
LVLGIKILVHSLGWPPSFYLSHLNAEITGMNHHVWLYFLKCYGIISFGNIFRKYVSKIQKTEPID